MNLNLNNLLILFSLNIIFLTLLISCSEIQTERTLVSGKNKKGSKETAKKYIEFAKMPYCIETNINCSSCQVIIKYVYKLIEKETYKISGENVTMVINRNSISKETVISFAGPKSDNKKFIQEIYSSGFAKKTSYNSKVEKVFWDAYSSFKKNLEIKITEIVKENKSEKVIFVGHSFGGSLAILAAFDLNKNNILDKNNSQKIISFAALKIGNVQFLHDVHSVFTQGIIRLRNYYDLYPYIPRCIFIPEFNVFRCYNDYVNLLRVWPVYSHYLWGYSPFIRRRLISSVPQILKSQGIKLSKIDLSNSKPNSFKSSRNGKGEKSHKSNHSKGMKTSGLGKMLNKMSLNSKDKYKNPFSSLRSQSSSVSSRSSSFGGNSLNSFRPSFTSRYSSGNMGSSSGFTRRGLSNQRFLKVKNLLIFRNHF